LNGGVGTLIIVVVPIISFSYSRGCTPLADHGNSESQMTEHDFLDEEMAGDEDYNGRDIGEDTLWGY
jgi:hypothetical protein